MLLYTHGTQGLFDVIDVIKPVGIVWSPKKGHFTMVAPQFLADRKESRFALYKGIVLMASYVGSTRIPRFVPKCEAV